MSRSWVAVSAIAMLVPCCVPAYAANTIQCANPGTGSSSSNAVSINANSCVDFSTTVQGANNWYYGYYTSESSPGVVNPNAPVYPPILDPKTFTSMTPTPLLGANGQVLPNQYLGVWSQNFFQYFTSLDAFGGHSNANYTDLHTIDTLPGEPWVWVPGANSYCNFSGIGYYNCNPIGGYDPKNPGSADSGNYWATRRYVVPTGFSGTVDVDVSSQRQSDIPNSQGYTDYIVKESNGVMTTLGSISVPGNATTSQVFSTNLTTTVNSGDFLDFVIVDNFSTFRTPTGTATGYADFASGQFQIDTITGLNPAFVPTPEPGTTALMGAGLLLLGFARRRLS